jgi:lamin tail-like protein
VISTHVRPQSPIARRVCAALAGAVLLLACLSSAAAFHAPSAGGVATRPVAAEAHVAAADLAEATAHLVVSEVMTGGSSASDEFIELYNPGSQALPLEGLEVIYVTASGGTITRKASWASGSPGVAAGAHVLIANVAGAFAAVADVTYTNGLAATGGSVAIRIIGASAGVDAAGWGNAASTWMESLPAVAPVAGHSIERLPGGSQGSGQDTDQNSLDFIESATPDPQNSLSSPIPVATPEPSPTRPGTPTPTPATSASPTPSDPGTPEPTTQPTPTVEPTSTPIPTPTPTPVPTASPAQPPITIAEARVRPDGSSVTVEGTSLSDSAFTEGGGYLADSAAGIAVLLGDGSFARGQQLRVTGIVDDRFSQRTIRADAGGVEVIGPSADPASQASATGAIGEPLEGEVVEVAGIIAGAPTTLTTGIAVDLDDGSGPVRVLVGNATSIDTTGWTRGANLHLRGVVGQRDSGGTGTAGYRVQPRDAADVLSFQPPATPTPTPSVTASPTPSPSGDPSVISIAAARARPVNAHVAVHGIVTLPSDMAEEGTAAIQDSSGAILLRLGDETGNLALGDLIEVAGTRSTKAGMETIRVSEAPRRLGQQAQPDARRRATGSLGEEDEAVLVIARGAVTTSPRRTSAQNIYFDIDDGSGPIRIFVSPRSGASAEGIVIGSWVEVRGVLGQETTGRLPDRGYRIWPRIAADLEIMAAATAGAGAPAGASSAGDGSTAPGFAAGSASGSSEGLAGGGGAGGELAPQQGVPQLGTNAEVPSRGALPASGGALAPSHGPSSAPAAGLLGLGGLLLTGAGMLVAPRGRVRELLRALWDRVRGRPDPEDEPLGGGLGASLEPMPALVPLTVLDGAQRGPRTDGERILPPT